MLPAASIYTAVLVLSLTSLLVCTRLSPRSRRRPNDPRRLIALAVAILTGFLVLFSPLDELSDRFFSAHMIEHELLLFTMPIALLAALPIPIGIIAPWRLLPPVWRRSIGRSWNWTRRSLTGLRSLEWPIPAFLVSTLVLWLWHAPALYDLALKSEWIHTVEHVSFVVASLLYWRPLLTARRSGVLNSNAKRVLYLMADGMQGGLLGALIALDNSVLYTGYLSQVGASFQAVLADQHLGGAIMWFSGPVFCSVIAALVLDNGEAGSIHTSGPNARSASGRHNGHSAVIARTSAERPHIAVPRNRTAADC